MSFSLIHYFRQQWNLDAMIRVHRKNNMLKCGKRSHFFLRTEQVQKENSKQLDAYSTHYAIFALALMEFHYVHTFKEQIHQICVDKQTRIALKGRCISACKHEMGPNIKEERGVDFKSLRHKRAYVVAYVIAWRRRWDLNILSPVMRARSTYQYSIQIRTGHFLVFWLVCSRGDATKTVSRYQKGVLQF